MSRSYTPAAAFAMMRDDDVIRFACDVARNVAFAKADARTVDADGLRVADYVRVPEEREAWATRVSSLLSLPLKDFEIAMSAQPVRKSRVPKPEGGEREIVVPTFIRRCVSNVLNHVLAATCDDLLPVHVRAYRPGDEDVVREAILDVAEGVLDGRICFFAKLDIRAYFTSVPWSAVETALKHYGYPDDFINYVMAVIRCPMVERVAGRLINRPNARGIQQGLPESATLANMVPFALDQRLANLRGLVVVRYSDDIFIGARDRDSVVAAVRAVAAWCRGHDLQLKGVLATTKLARLVHDVRREKIVLLGAEIDGSGYVHMPASKLKEKLTELRRRFERVAIGNASGVSRYGNGGGVDRFDEADLLSMKRAFLDYWSLLDPRGMKKAECTFARRFPVTPDPLGDGRGTLWTALLWRRSRETAAGTSRTIHPPIETSEAGSSVHTRTPSRGARAVLSPDEETPKQTHIPHGGTTGVRGQEVFTLDDLDSEPEPTLKSRVAGDFEMAGGREQLAMPMDDDPLYTDDGAGASFLLDEEVALLSDADERKFYRFHPRPEPREGAVSGDSGSGASPSAPSFENGMMFFIEAVRVRLGGRATVLVGTQAFVGGLAVSAPTVHKFAGRSEAAVVRTVSMLLPSASSVPITFVTTATWLAKSLLQPHRRIRAPIIFCLVMDLHERARRCDFDVFVAGGRTLPPSLRAAVLAAIEAHQKRAA